jgi:hydroxypyruvate reductase
MTSPRDWLLSAFHAALDAVDPFMLVQPHLPEPPKGRTLVIGGGKAAAAMARAMEDNWPLEAALSGMVITRYQHGLPCQRIKVLEASHPLPDGRGAEAALHMLDQVRQLGEEDLLLVLLSGGGSSLLAVPAGDIQLEDLREVTRALLASGAAIQDINTVRKHLTRFSGGRVAALSKAPVMSLIISDVVGNDPTHIASGPCAPDPTTYADALAILKRHAISLPHSVQLHIEMGIKGNIPETPKPGDPLFNHTRNIIIGSAQNSMAAAETSLKGYGVEVINLGEIEGNSTSLAIAHADLIREQIPKLSRPFALLSGGESTVRVDNSSGRGGRNTEYLLSLCMALQDMKEIWALACDTDGIDGTEDNAGALWTPDTIARSVKLGLDAECLLQENNTYEFFSRLGDVIVTGPTRTNVNDFRLVLVL